MTLRSKTVVILVALAGSIWPGEARSQTETFRFRQKTQGAYASLFGFLRDGRIYYVNVFFQESAEADNTGGGSPASEVEVGIGIYDADTFEPYFVGESFGPLDRNDYQFRGMKSASLEVTVPMTDSFTGELAGDATVVLDLEGVGEIDRQLGTTFEDSDTFRVKLHGDTQTRTMTPSGSVTVGGEVIPLDEAVSEMTSVKYSVLAIFRR